MSDYLRKASIPFKLAGGGTELMVPAAEVAAARVALAKEGSQLALTPALMDSTHAHLAAGCAAAYFLFGHTPTLKCMLARRK